MIVPVADQAAQQIGPPQQGAVGRRRAPEHHVVAAAGAGVPAVEHELLGAEPRLTRLVVERGRLMHELGPAVRGMQVDFDDARIRRHLDVVQPRDRASGGVPSTMTGIARLAAVCSIAAIEIEVVLGRSDRRHEHVQRAHAAARRRAPCGSRRPRILLAAAAVPRPAPWRAAGPRASARTASWRLRQRRRGSRTDRLSSVASTHPAPPTAASRAAIGSRSANHRESGTGARIAGTRGRSSSARRVVLTCLVFTACHRLGRRRTGARTRRRGRAPARRRAPGARAPLRPSTPTSADRRSPAAAVRP